MLKSLFWSILEQGGAKIVTLAIQVILARILAPGVFGVIAILLAFTELADTIAQSGLGMALVQRDKASDEDFSTGFWMCLAVSVVMYVLLFLFAPVISAFYNQEDLTILIRVMSLTVIFNSANSVQRSYLQRRMDFEGLFRVTFFAKLASGVLAVVAAFAGFGIWALVMQYVSCSVFTFLAMLVFVPWRPGLTFSFKVAKELFSYGWEICVTGILNSLYSRLSELLLGKFCTMSDVGLYSQGRKYPLAAVSVLSNALQNVFFPAFSSIKDNLEKLVAEIRQFLVVGSYIFVPFALFATVAAEPLVVLLLTDSWFDCVPVFQMTSVSYSLLLLQVINLRAYMALGDSRLYLNLQIIKLSVSFVAVFIAVVLTHDIYVVAFVNAAAFMLSVLFVDLQPAKRMFGYSGLQQLKDILPTYVLAVIASVCAYAVLFLDLPYIVLLLLQLLVFTVVYLGGSALFKVKGFKDCVVMLKRVLGRSRRGE